MNQEKLDDKDTVATVTAEIDGSEDVTDIQAAIDSLPPSGGVVNVKTVHRKTGTRMTEEILKEVWRQHRENKDNSHDLIQHFCRGCLDLLLKLYKQKVREAIDSKEILNRLFHRWQKQVEECGLNSHDDSFENGHEWFKEEFKKELELK